MALNLALPPQPASARDPAAYVEGFEAGAAAERAKLQASGADQTASAGANVWDEIAADLNAKAGLSVPHQES